MEAANSRRRQQVRVGGNGRQQVLVKLAISEEDSAVLIGVGHES